MHILEDTLWLGRERLEGKDSAEGEAWAGGKGGGGYKQVMMPSTVCSWDRIVQVYDQHHHTGLQPWHTFSDYKTPNKTTNDGTHTTTNTCTNNNAISYTLTNNRKHTLANSCAN